MSGNGQVGIQYFNTATPLTIEARDANGNLVPNLPVSWAVTQGQGTVVSPPDRTDSNGRASAYYRGDVTPGYTFSQQTVLVSSSVGSATFVVTTNVSRLPNGSMAELPVADLVAPAYGDPPLSGRSGGTLPGVIKIAVAAQSGIQSGQPVPNVGFRIVDANDPTLPPPAYCKGQNQLLTDAQGVGTCDLVITAQPGTYGIAVEIGGYRISRSMLLNVSSAQSCNYTVVVSSQQFSAVAGIGTLNITAGSGCDWTAVSNANWITITNGQSGLGSGGAAFSVAANPGASRVGTITVAGQVVTITQAGTGGTTTPGLQITTPANLPSATVGAAYSATLSATGGRAPYIWIASSALPGGLTLNTNTGVISGTPTLAGTFSIPVTATDQGGLTQSQTFTITVLTPSGGTGGGGAPGDLKFLNTAFPNATAGSPYQEILNSAGGCATPFSAPSVYSLVGGALPQGVSIKALDGRTYAVAGTPVSAGSFNFTVQVKDPCGKIATANFALTVVNGTGGGGTTPPSTGSVSTNPASLSFTLSNGNAGTQQQLPLTINGPAGSTFSAATLAGIWLQIIGDSSGPFGTTIIVRAAPTGAQTNGTYTGSVLITSSAGSATVPVTLTIGSGGGGGGTGQTAVITVAPTAVNTTVEVGSFPITQIVSISNASGVARVSIQTSTVTGGNWLTVDRTTADTPSSVNITLNPTGLAPSLYTGAISIVPTAPSGATQVIPVNFRVLPPAGLSVSPINLTFVNQPGMPNSGAQSLKVLSTGTDFAATISATTVSGGNWLTVTPNQGTTPVTATVSVNTVGLAPGTYIGSVQITPGVSNVTPISIPVTVTVPQLAPVVAAVSNAASYQAGAVAPGEIVTLFGTGLGPSALAAANVSAGRLDSTVQETRVYFDEFSAPLVYTSSGQLSAIVPYAVEGRASTKIVVEYKGIRSSPIEMRVAQSAPGIFTLSSNGQAAALNQDGGINGSQNGAEPGSIIVFYATGEGQTNPRGQDGKLATDAVLPKPLLPVTVRINGEVADVKYAGAAPGMSAGVMQVNAVIPKTAPRGVSVPVTLQVGDNISLNGATIAIKP